MSEPIAVVVPKELYYHEVAYVRGLEARVAKLEAATQGMLDEWDKFTRYGSPMAKAANERVAFARAALKDAPQ
jgi:hypothetical protein